MSHVERLDRRRWARVRVEVFDRDGWRCRACGRPGALECDHVVPLHRGGAPYSLANLQTLCRGCHIAKSRAESRKRPDAAALAWMALIAELTGTSA